MGVWDKTFKLKNILQNLKFVTIKIENFFFIRGVVKRISYLLSILYLFDQIKKYENVKKISLVNLSILYVGRCARKNCFIITYCIQRQMCHINMD